MNAILRITCASLVLAGIGARPSWAADVDGNFAAGVNAANAKLRGGDVEGALAQYADVRTLAPESADLSYNMAVAQYRKGDVAAAEQLFQSAATSENDMLAGKARYNLGNCNYAEGLKLAQSDREGAIRQLESAIDNYRSSLEVDSANGDARANIELAARLIDKLREEQQQEQQQNQQNQQQDQQQQSSDEQQNNQQQNSQDQQDQKQNEKQDQQQQNEQQENKDQQKQDQQSSDQQNKDQKNQDQQQDQNKDQQQQDSKSQPSQNDKQQKQKDRQSKDQQQHDQQKQDDQQNDQSKQDQQRQQQDSAQQNEQQSAPKDQSQDAKSQQQQQQNRSQQRPQRPQHDSATPEESKEQQGKQPPQGELTSATEDEAKEGQEKQAVAAFDPTRDGEMTQEEAEKMLQAIRDREMLRRYDQRREEMQQYIPVDRDW